MNTVVAAFLTSILGILGIFLAVMPLIIDLIKDNWRKRFASQIQKGIKNNLLTYEDLQHISERWKQDRKAVLWTLRVLLAEAISGENDLIENIDGIRLLIQSHLTKEPFAELPENISLQLHMIANEKSVDKISEKLAQLATSLSDIYASSQKDMKIQKQLTFWGFVFGFLGLVISLGNIIF